MDARSLRRAIESGETSPEDAVDSLAALASGAPTRGGRLEAWRLLGDVAGRSLGARWKAAERAAWALLDIARTYVSPADRSLLLSAMGRAFRNAWLVPFVHARLADDDESIAEAAIGAAGGLGFPGLEDAVARFLTPEAPRRLRLAAVAALGRMGAVSAAPRLAAFVRARSEESAAALRALAEIRSTVARADAVEILGGPLSRDTDAAATRYLAEIGAEEVRPTLRRLARNEDPRLRAVAISAARALDVERTEDAGTRILAALAEPDRALRAVLARRLRTRPPDEVVAQARTLLGDDPAGVLQVLGEVRTPEVSRYLLEVAAREDLPARVRARAATCVEANEPWEREALARIVAQGKDSDVRAAAAQTMGAFASIDDVFRHLGALGTDASPQLRGALLWALQLAARPGALTPADRTRCEKEVRRLLADPDGLVRRRAAYVAGNLGLAALAADLGRLARTDETSPDLKTAALVALAELAVPATAVDVVALLARSDDPQIVAAASRTLLAIVWGGGTVDLSSLAAKVARLMAAKSPLAREGGVRLAGLHPGLVATGAVLALAKDPSPRVREVAVTAIGRLGDADAEAETVLAAALADPDPGMQERAADALVALPGGKGFDRAVGWVAGDADGWARGRVASKIVLPPDVRAAATTLAGALRRIGADDAAYEPLLVLQAKALEAAAPKSASAAGADVDGAIVAAFPSFRRLAPVRGFAQHAKSLRTAEALCRTTSAIPDADHSPPIVLWSKVLEGWLHAALSPRLRKLQSDAARLWDQVDRVQSDAWPAYQTWLDARWTDPVTLGDARVDVALRSVPNALRDLGERRRRPLDSPLSITEWGRLLLLLGVDHASGVKNLLGVTGTAESTAKTAHRLLAIAAVRNLVTHRATAGPATLDAFRRTYYATFEEVVKLGSLSRGPSS